MAPLLSEVSLKRADPLMRALELRLQGVAHRNRLLQLLLHLHMHVCRMVRVRSGVRVSVSKLCVYMG